ncbi:MAG: glycosyltransferase family 4 protein [Planctomycetes bacterium]|nr:glycosyltransferase family 4 protein [Planctomycetota bacterium]
MPRLRIGIDARILCNRRCGGQYTYLTNVVQWFLRCRPQHEYFFYAHRPFDGEWAGVRARTGGGRLPGTLWVQTVLPVLAHLDRIDVLWGPGQVLPLVLPAPIASVVTVHDLTFLRYAATMPRMLAGTLRAFVPPSVSRADRVITDSEAVRRELEVFAGGAAKTTVIGLGVSERFAPIKPERIAEAARRHGLAGPYVLAVGTLEPRKNLSAAVAAYARLADRWKGRLAVAGVRGWRWSPREMPGVTWLGFVPEEDLPVLYAGAEALLFSSLYEGFGLPILEAMSCGTPVVCSDIPVFREVAGDDAVYVPPRDPEAIAEALAGLLGDAARRGELSRRGRVRAQGNRWAGAAERTFDVLCEAAHSAR